MGPYVGILMYVLECVCVLGEHQQRHRQDGVGYKNEVYGDEYDMPVYDERGCVKYT